MVNLSRRFKLEYTDSNGDQQVIAETGQNTGALTIDRHVHIRRKNDPDILKLWLEGSNFGQAIPTRKSEFDLADNGEDEPEILYYQYNRETDSFDLKNRFYAKNTGTINENGQLALKLYSHMRYTSRSQVDTGTITSDVGTAMNNVLPSGYQASIPASVTPPNVKNYSLNARREKGYQELTRNYNYAFTFTSQQDNNNNYLVKYEPVGFGGTVDTLVSNEQAGKQVITDVDTSNDVFTVNGDQTNTLVVNQSILVENSTGNDGTYTITNLNYDSNNNETEITVNENVSSSTADGYIIPGGQAIFKSWEKDKTDSIINKVKVVGTNSNGETVTATATNQTQINNFGEKFKEYKIGYVEDSTEAQQIAENYLVPGLNDDGTDITKVPESGTVKTTVYTDNVVNDSFQVVDNLRKIDDTYTCVQQRNYWPEGVSELEFEFEQENLEEAARDSENLRDERARLYPSQDNTIDINFGDFNAENDTANADTDTDESERDPPVNGSTGERIGNVQGAFANESIADANGNKIVEADIPNLTDGVEIWIATFHIDIIRCDGSNTSEFEVQIEDQVSDLLEFDENITFVEHNAGGWGGITVTSIGQSDGGDTFAGRLTNNDGDYWEAKLSLSIDAMEEHTHEFSTNTNNHDHAVTVDDLGHGGSGDASEHVITGQQIQKLLQLLEEVETDR
jgi:hypothetical protein